MKLEECEQSLSLLGVEVRDLRGELARLQTEAERFTQLLAEKEAVLSELQHDYAEASGRADAASASLTEAEAQLRLRIEQVSDLEQQRDALQSRGA